MRSKNIKVLLFAGLLAAMILPFSVMDVSAAPNENANEKASEKKGKLLLNGEKTKTKKMIEQTKELNRLIKLESLAESKDRPGIQKQIQKILDDRPTVSITDADIKKIRGNIDSLGENLETINKFLDGSLDTRIVSIGTDYENNSLRVGLLNMDLTDKQYEKVEDKIRKIVGDDVDITLEKSGYLILTCSQTGNCNPTQAGVKMTAEDSTPCSIGYKATFEGKNGFITSGHCMENTSAGEKVYQPQKLWWDEPENRVGSVVKNTLALHILIVIVHLLK